jgi:hypothetical protein
MEAQVGDGSAELVQPSVDTDEEVVVRTGGQYSASGRVVELCGLRDL